MGIIGNNFVRNTGVHRSIGEVVARTPGNAMMYSLFCNNRCHDGETTVISGAALPLGSYFPDTFYPPIIAGEMSLRMTATGNVTCNLYPSKSMTIDLTGSGNLEATAALVISMLLALSGSGNLEADIQGRVNMSIDLIGEGGLAASMEGIANMIINMLGEGTLEATISAYGNMAIDIVVTGTGLTTANVGQAVWSALAAVNNEPLTMGEKLNDAGAAANPWTEVLPGTYTGSQAGKVIDDIKKKANMIPGLY